jgi:hypothetical protein
MKCQLKERLESACDVEAGRNPIEITHTTLLADGA